jgi:hypothetical protein
MSVAESGIVGIADYVKAVVKIPMPRTKYRIGVRNMAVYQRCRHQVGVSRYCRYVVFVGVIICTVENH